MSKQLYEWVTIKSEKDLPKEDGEYTCQYSYKDNTGTHFFISNMPFKDGWFRDVPANGKILQYLAPVIPTQVSEEVQYAWLKCR